MKYKVYDTFLFFNELDLLEIRLNILNDYVDYFVIGECANTFTGNKKPLYFNENKKRFEKFLGKIIYVKIPPKKFNKVWDNDFYQRNYLIKGLKNAKINDIIHLSDLDEIPNPITLKNIIPLLKDKIFSLNQFLFYYYLNNLNLEVWNRAKVFKFGSMKNFDLQTIRDLEINNLLPCTYVNDGGWHFSYLGGVEKIKYKIKSFAHQEYNKKEYLDNIKDNLKKTDEDIFNRFTKFVKVKIQGDNYPKWLVENKEKYKHLISP